MTRFVRFGVSLSVSLCLSLSLSPRRTEVAGAQPVLIRDRHGVIVHLLHLGVSALDGLHDGDEDMYEETPLGADGQLADASHARPS